MLIQRSFFTAIAVGIAILMVSVASAAKPNVLIITVDDMSADSLGVFGCQLGDTSPHIDQFAKQSLRFKHAHVQVGNCMPGRNIMWSGMLAHANGVEGFVQNKQADYPVLCDLAQSAGYFAAIRGKVSHSTPYLPYAWDAVLDSDSQGKKFHTKDAASYGQSARDGIAMAKQQGKPFCLLINISDPHKPFYAQGRGGDTVADPHVPTRVFTADEVPVPGFLPDDEVIRKELAHYYSSVRRADDCFGEIMNALDESGARDQTFVMFLSDHGMPLPFAKTQLYHHSTHTPLIVRWPTVTEAGSVDETHLVSAVDFVPTLLDVMETTHPAPDRLHGRSFAKLFAGQPLADRDFVVLQYNENSGRARHPMRGIETRQFLYLYNPWSNGERKFATATTGTMTYRQMVKRAPSEPNIAARLELFDHRVLEELYDVQSDPDCLFNLIDDPAHREILDSLRTKLAGELARVKDPVAPLVAALDDDQLRIDYMAAEDERYRKAREARQRGNQSQGARGKLKNAITIKVPESIRAGQTMTVIIRHQIPAALQTQQLHVTLKSVDPKNPNSGKRIERKVTEADGKGMVSIDFDVPDSEAAAYQVAAFLGKDFQTSLQHVNSSVIARE